jgi:hypothetical protein
MRLLTIFLCSIFSTVIFCSDSEFPEFFGSPNYLNAAQDDSTFDDSYTSHSSSRPQGPKVRRISPKRKRPVANMNRGGAFDPYNGDEPERCFEEGYTTEVPQERTRSHRHAKK